MRSGRPLSLVALGLLVGVFCEPLWQWLYARLLDRVARQHGGVLRTLHEALSLTAPAHQPALWFALGMLFALSIGYRAWLKKQIVLTATWAAEIRHLIPRCLPGKRRLLTGGARLLDGELSKTINIVPIEWQTAEIKWSPLGQVHCALWARDTFTIARMDKDNLATLAVHYELWGRQLFWPTLSRWRKDGHIPFLIWARRNMKPGEAKAASATPDTAT